VQQRIRENGQGAVSRGILEAVSEDGFPELGVSDPRKQPHYRTTRMLYNL